MASTHLVVVHPNWLLSGISRRTLVFLTGGMELSTPMGCAGRLSLKESYIVDHHWFLINWHFDKEGVPLYILSHCGSQCHRPHKSYFWWSLLLKGILSHFGEQDTSHHNNWCKLDIPKKVDPHAVLLGLRLCVSPFPPQKTHIISVPLLTWNLWNIFSTSHITPIGCLRNRHSTPVIPLVSQVQVKCNRKPLCSYSVSWCDKPPMRDITHVSWIWFIVSLHCITFLEDTFHGVHISILKLRISVQLSFQSFAYRTTTTFLLSGRHGRALKRRGISRWFILLDCGFQDLKKVDVFLRYALFPWVSVCKVRLECSNYSSWCNRRVLSDGYAIAQPCHTLGIHTLRHTLDNAPAQVSLYGVRVIVTSWLDAVLMLWSSQLVIRPHNSSVGVFCGLWLQGDSTC